MEGAEGARHGREHRVGVVRERERERGDSEAEEARGAIEKS